MFRIGGGALGRGKEKEDEERRQREEDRRKLLSGLGADINDDGVGLVTLNHNPLQ